MDKGPTLEWHIPGWDEQATCKPWINFAGTFPLIKFQYSGGLVGDI